MTQGERGQVDSEEPQTRGSLAREHGVRELRIGPECGDLQEHPEGQIGHVDMGECTHLAAVVEDERKGDVEDEQEDDDGADAQSDVSSHEGPAVPPTG